MTDLVRRTDPDSWTAVLGDVGDLAAKIARTEFVPKGLQGNPAGVAAAILTGREMNLGPMASLRGIHIVEGRASLTAEMLAARILAAGHEIRWIASTDQRATVKITRADGLSEAEATWTMADAQRAGLAGKTVWKSYGRAMLRHRALTEAASMACPDVALGLDVGMSALDEPEHHTPVVVQIAQEAPQEPITAEVVELADPDIPEPTEAPCTGAQIRKLGALVGQWEAIEDRKLDRDERRRLIGFYAGVDDPDTLGSAKDLTLAQASAAIEALQDYVLAADEAVEAVEAEVVEDSHPETLIP